MKLISKYLLILCAALACALARADTVLVQYAFSGMQGDEHEVTPERVVPGMVAGALVRGKGLNYMVKVPGTFAANGWTTSEQANDTDYFEFEVRAEGTEFTLLALEFEEFANAKGPEFFTVRSSLDGFSTDLTEPLRHTADTLAGKHTLKLGPAFARLRGPVTFRFVAWGAKSGGSGVWALGAVKRPAWLKLSGSLNR